MSFGPFDPSPTAPWKLIDQCGEAILAASELLAERGPYSREVVAALHALADATQAALTVVGATVGQSNEELRPLDTRTEDMLPRLRRAYDVLDIAPPQT